MSPLARDCPSSSRARSPICRAARSRGRQRKPSGFRCVMQNPSPSASTARSVRAKCAPMSPISRGWPTHSSSPIPMRACPMNSASMTKAPTIWRRWSANLPMPVSSTSSAAAAARRPPTSMPWRNASRASRRGFLSRSRPCCGFRGWSRFASRLTSASSTSASAPMSRARRVSAS